MSLLLGKDAAAGTEVELPVDALRRHAIVLGSTGSGKTVLCKCIVEEAVRNGVPVIAVDPQGDIASLALREDPERLQEKGTPASTQQEFFDRARVAIFTPASTKGIPICVQPLRFPDQGVSREEAVLAIDMTAASLAGILGYDLTSPQGKGARACLFLILDDAYGHERAPKDLEALARLVLDPPEAVAAALPEIIPRREREDLARKVRLLTVGAPSLLFTMGMQLDLDALLDTRDGKVPVNIVYLNSLTADTDKQFFLTALLREVYLWMLRNPSDRLQLVLYIDEIGPYIPPYPRNPPPKEAYALLFKQARKYGVGLVASTQNVTDLDYKALGQANTWALGRLVMSQDLARVAKIVASIDPVHAEDILGKLPRLTPSEFFLLTPESRDRIVLFQTRWLVTKHRTLEEEELAAAISPETRAFFEHPRPAAPSVTATQPVAAGPPVPAPPLAAPPIREAIVAQLESLREAAPAATLAGKVGLDAAAASRELKAMVQTGVCATGRKDGTGEELFWLARYKFQPAIGVTREVLTIPMRIAQVDAVKRAGSALEHRHLAATEEIVAAELDHLPLWKVTSMRTTKSPLMPAKDHIDDYYVSARSGSFMTVQGRDMIFEKVARTDAGKVEDLDDDANVTFEPRVPGEVENLPPIKVPLSGAQKIVSSTFGVRPLEGRLAVLPVWRLTARSKEGNRRRNLVMEAVSGRILSGEF